MHDRRLDVPSRVAHAPTTDECARCLAAAVSRRHFVGVAVAPVVAAALAACGGGDGGAGPGDGGGGGGGGGIADIPSGVNLTVTANGQVITIPLASNAALAGAGGVVFLASEHTLVLNAGTEFRAFTSVCTHQGCDVIKRRGDRLHCDCHGSEYDATGRNVAGPAESPLRAYSATFDVMANAVTVRKG